jgi:hypothetical protein
MNDIKEKITELEVRAYVYGAFRAKPIVFDVKSIRRSLKKYSRELNAILYESWRDGWNKNLHALTYSDYILSPQDIKKSTYRSAIRYVQSAMIKYQYHYTCKIIKCQHKILRRINMEIKITIEAPEIVSAITALSESLRGLSISTPATPEAPVEYIQMALPVEQPISQPEPAKAEASPVVEVPTAAPQYTIAELAKAGAEFVGNSTENRNALIKCINDNFGVPAITMIPKERLGEFAMALRTLGGNI